MPVTKLTHEQRQELIQKLRAGERQADLTKEYGITRGTVSYYARQALGGASALKPKRQAGVLTKKIVALFEKGLNGREIDEKLKLYRGCAAYHLLRHKAALTMNGASGGPEKVKRRIKPIVLNMETEEADQASRMSSVLDLAWSKLGFEEKLRAIETLEKEK